MPANLSVIRRLFLLFVLTATLPAFADQVCVGPKLSGIAVTAASPSLYAGQSEQFTATGTYSCKNGRTATSDMTTEVVWTSTNPAAATVGATGLATVPAGAITNASTLIVAAFQRFSTSGTLTVAPPPLQSIVISPASATIAKGLTQQFRAVGTYLGGSTADITPQVIWSSSKTAVATVGANGVATGTGIGNAGITAMLGAITSAGATLNVTAAQLTGISISPQNPSLAKGLTQQFRATGTYTDATTADITSSVTWSSSNLAAATITPTGMATAAGVGSSQISASSNSMSASTLLTITPAQIASIAVTPASTSIAKGQTQQFAAVGTYTDGTTQALSSGLTWTSSDQTIATLGPDGLASGVGVGSATVTATSGGLSGTASLTVNAAALVSIAVGPSNASAAKGTTQQFTATGTYTDASTKDLTQAVTWSSSSNALATVSPTGLGTAVGVGSAAITATDSVTGISGTDAFSVTPAVVTQVVVTPAGQSIPLGTTLQMVATAQFTDGTTQDVSASIQWSSSNPAAGSISNTAGSVGLLTSLTQGSTNAVATTAAGVSGSAPVTVTSAALTSIAVTSKSSSIPLGTQEQFTATGSYTDGTTQNLTSQAQWTTSDANIATVSSAGLASTVTTGDATITASLNSIQGGAPLTVTQAVLTSIVVSPGSASIPLGTSHQFTATGSYTDGTSKDITANVNWTTSDPTIATISVTSATAGLASTVAVGGVTVTATSGSITGTAQLTVNQAALASIAVLPSAATIPLGNTQQFTATGSYTDGSTMSLTNLVTWSSSNITAAVISNSAGTQGLATSAGTGQTTISATYAGMSGQTTLDVSQPQLLSLAVTPQTPSVAAGATAQLTATGTFTNGTQDVTSASTWTSADSTIATVDATGLVHGLKAGTVMITATDGSVSNATTVTVSPASGPAVLVSLAITPNPVTIPSSATAQLTATGTYSDGSTRDLTTSVAWSSSNSQLMTVSALGVVTSGSNAGSATVTATVGTISAQVIVTIRGGFAR